MSNATNRTFPVFDLKAISDYQNVKHSQTAIFSELIAFNVVMLVLSLVFCRVEPLKSRGIIPPCSLFLSLTALCIRLSANFTVTQTTLDLVPIQMGAMNMVWVTAIIQYFRYLIKQRIEHNKQNGTYKRNLFQKIINFIFVSNIGLAISLGIYVFCILMLMAGTWISLYATKTFYTAIIYILVILVVLQIVTASSLVIVDLIIDTWRFGVFSGTYSRRDPLVFRLDGIFILVVCFCSAAYTIFSQVSQAYMVSEGLTSRSVGLWAPLGYIDYTQRFFLIMVGGGTCICVIIKRWIMQRLVTGKKKQKISTAEHLDRVWAKEEGRVALVKYCEAEFSVENARAYDDSTKYRDIKDPNEKIKLANHIYDSYVADHNSLLHVNTSQSVRLSLAEKMTKLPESPNTSELDTLFEDFELEVKKNLLDTFSRFMVSDDFAILETEKDV